MRSILIRLKKLRTYKRFCGVLLSCFLGLVFFMNSSLEAYASLDSNSWHATGEVFNINYIYGNQNSTYYAQSNQNILGSNNIYKDVTINVIDHFIIDNFDSDNYYSGYLQSRNTFTIDVNSIGAANNIAVDILDISTEYNGDLTNVSVITPQNQVNSSSASSRSFNLRRDCILYFGDKKFYLADIYITYHITLRVSAYSSAHTLTTLSCNISSSSVNSVGYGNFSPNLTQEIVDNIINDSSNISDSLNSEVLSAGAVESAADQAISSALPSADTQLNDILNYDYTSIGTDSLTALSFWKSLGDYILSNSNLVGIGALLVACLFLGFVIYLLRL